jgi:GNAT superfamily N-acetyltransferase
MKADLNDVIEAIEQTNEETAPYYCIDTESIVWPIEGQEEDEDENAINLPSRYDRNDYQNMVDFIDTVKDEEAQEWLSNAIHGRGAFRMFRAACEKFHLLEDWYDFEAQAHRSLAIAWCEENGIVWTDAEKQPEKDEDDVSDFLHEEYQETEEETEEPVQEIAVSYRTVVITEKNLMNALYIADAYLHMGKPGTSDLELAQKQLETWKKNGCEVIAASDHGRYVGLAAGKEEADGFCIEAVYVTEDCRRRGIGRMLMHYYETEHANVSSLHLSVADTNAAAEAFFDALGYHVLPVKVMRKETCMK